VGDIAGEVPDLEGLWVAPWGTYVEIVDDDGNRVSDGTEGEIVVTSLTNFAMPLIRYRIGDRGVLAPLPKDNQKKYGQVLMSLLGRTLDTIHCKDGTLVHASYFTQLLFFKDWVSNFQVIQKSPSSILFKIIRSEAKFREDDLKEITMKTKLALGGDCEVEFEFVDEIEPSVSGKHRYIISDFDSA
jgi:phenylacetate-CoA ligase